MFVSGSNNFRLLANRIFNNQSTNSGGGLYVSFYGNVLADNNFIAANTSTNGAAEVGVGGPGSFSGRHNTFAAANPGSGVAVSAGNEISGDVITLTNSILEGYAVGLRTGPLAATINADGVLWSGVTTQTQGSSITVTHAYTGNAAFANSATRDYHLTSASAAIDKGVSTSLTIDFDGNTRPQGSAPDLGADEFVNFAVYLPIIRK